MSKSQVTIKDIAKMLDISPSTVSRSLNDHPDISPETKARVNALAEKYNYQPNVQAQNLRTRSTKTIGVIIPEIVHFFFSTVIAGIEKKANERGYRIMFCQSNESHEKEVLEAKSLLSHRVDGLLISYAKDSKNLQHFHDAIDKEIPIVFFDRMMEELDVTNVVVDDYEGAKNATQHLIDQGCKRIAHMAAPTNLSIGQQRLQGYLDALEANNIQKHDELIRYDGEGYQEDGFSCMERMLQLKEIPDAVFANNDMVACGAMAAIKKAGLKIPEDIAVVGFSNWQFTQYIEPRLTSVAQPGYNMGETATELLIDEIESKEPVQHQTVSLSTELIIRESSMR